MDHAIEQELKHWPQLNITSAILQQLGFDDMAAFEYALEQAQRLRQQFHQRTQSFGSDTLELHAATSTQASGHHYLVDLDREASTLFAILAPFISASLNYKTVYITAADQQSEEIYAHYFNLQALSQYRAHSLENMCVDIDLFDADPDFDYSNHHKKPSLINHSAGTQHDMLHYAFARACLDPACTAIYLRGNITLSTQSAAAFYSRYSIQLYCLAALDVPDLNPLHQTENIDFKKLFWKVKSQRAMEICQHMAHQNAAFISQMTKLNVEQSELLIDDLLYSEHVFEKLSVFSEFSETLTTRPCIA